MTYLEYTDQLINTFQQKKAETLQNYDELRQLSRLKGTDEAQEYLSQVNNCNAIADQASHILRCFLDGSISPGDPID